MRIDDTLLRRIESDLQLDVPFMRGKDLAVKNCWHFSTDGKAVDMIFNDDEDFVAGMNRIYVTLKGYPGVIILAFCLMDNHIHFVLYGPLDACKRFMHDYVRRTSRYIAYRYGEKHKLENVPIDHQIVDDQRYLKTVICYDVKNPPVAGIPYMGWDYPWSSGPLYFRNTGTWCSPSFLLDSPDSEEGGVVGERGIREQRALLRTKKVSGEMVRMLGKLVFPGEYVAWELVERIFKTQRSYHYFMCITREEEVDAHGGSISRLSIPMQEMRQHKNEVCRELYGTESTRTLTTEQRLRLAKVLRSRFNSSPRQIARLAGLVYEEVKDRF